MGYLESPKWALNSDIGGDSIGRCGYVNLTYLGLLVQDPAAITPIYLYDTADPAGYLPDFDLGL